MATPAPRGARRHAIVLLALTVAISTFGSAFLPAPSRIALAADGLALGDALILAGPGGQYGILTVAPSGSTMSVDGDPVDGYYPVTYDGVSGWTATGLIEVSDKGGGHNGGGGGGNSNGGGGGGGNHDRTRESGNGGIETVSADPVYSDNGEPVQPAPDTSAPAASDEPITGGTYGPGGAGYSEDQIVGIIYEAADNYGQSRDAMLRVARCESGLDPSAVGGGGAYYGLFQLVPTTFAGTPYGQYDIFDPWANANASGWLWSEGHKDEWVCQ
jgi:hypothetical protein